MIYLNSVFGYVVAMFLVIIGLQFGLRTNYLLTPPSNMAVVVSRSLIENPDEWQMGSADLVLTNETRGLEIQMFGDAGSIQVRKDGELAPSLDKSMNMWFSSNNQNYVHHAIMIWKEETAPAREARLIREIEYSKH